MYLQTRIFQKIQKAFHPHELELENESNQHSVPAGSESHFYLYLVSNVFEKMPKLKRHQFVYKILDQELKTGIHALRMQLFSPSEIVSGTIQKQQAPKCRGGDSLGIN